MIYNNNNNNDPSNKTFMLNSYNPEDEGDKNIFRMQLKALGKSHDPTNSSWDVNKLEAFKSVLTQHILNRIPDSKVKYSNIENRDEIQTIGKMYDLRITVISEKYGKLSTDLQVDMVMHKDCPHNLPQLIATEFKNELCKN